MPSIPGMFQSVINQIRQMAPRQRQRRFTAIREQHPVTTSLENQLKHPQ
ncbi:hypothetical protein OKW43_003680 [Paraburkholderia sp. WC7.3g]